VFFNDKNGKWVSSFHAWIIGISLFNPLAWRLTFV